MQQIGAAIFTISAHVRNVFIFWFLFVYVFLILTTSELYISESNMNRKWITKEVDYLTYIKEMCEKWRL